MARENKEFFSKVNNTFIFLFIFGCAQAFSLVAVSRGYSVVAECGLLIEVTSVVAEHQL